MINLPMGSLKYESMINLPMGSHKYD